MLTDFFLKIPYLLFFIPLMASVFINFVHQKRFMVTVVNCVLAIMIFFTIKMMINYGDFGTTHFINSSSNFNILSTEFRISIIGIFFFMNILFCNLLGFINFIGEVLLNKNLNQRHIKYFFSIYLIYIFAIVGIIFTYNIFNLFLFLEIYSLCIYVMISIYNKDNLNIVSYKFFTNNVFGSILFALTIFYMTIYFGTANMLDIKQQIITLNFEEHYEVFLMFILFLFSIIIKFFLTNTSRYHNTKNVGINFLSISNIFINVLIGIYLVFELMFFIFDTKIIFNFTTKYIVFFIASTLIIYNSLRALLSNITSTESNTIFNLFLRFNLIDFGYSLLSILLYQDDRRLCITLFLLHIFEFSSVNFLIYLFSQIISIIYGHNNLEYLNKNILFKYIFLIILINKIILPFGANLYINIDFLSYATGEFDNYMYLVPYFISKFLYFILFMNILINNKVPRSSDKHNILNKKYLSILYFSSFSIIVLVVAFNLLFRKYLGF